ncbi:glutamate ligase domain-containing protein [Streptomyces sp. NPDC059893]|uniref:glutamate ligase domain-containing protein n=1 Tax=Streptomyces sp. NPDC059893 TaxID=3346990 RepID=UPI003647E58B
MSAGRLQILERADGVTIINDAFNANPESMRAGLETLTSVAGDRRTVAVLGEMKELGDTAKAAHADIGRLVGELGIDVLVTVGTTDEMTALADAARPASPLRIESADDPDLLLPLLNRLLKNGDVVLVRASKSVGLEKFRASVRGMAGRSDRPRKHSISAAPSMPLSTGPVGATLRKGGRMGLPAGATAQGALCDGTGGAVAQAPPRATGRQFGT